MPGPVTGLPRLPLSISASTASWSILFSFLTMMSGAPSSRRRFNLLLRLIILLYKSFKSEVAKRPPSSCTMGRRSGGITGMASIIIQDGSFPDSRKASTTSSLLIILARFWPVDSFRPVLSSSASVSRSMASRSSLIASAPIPTRNLLPHVSLALWYSFSDKTCLYSKSVSPLSRTIYEAKYNTFSSTLGDKSRISPIRLGIPLKYQIWDTGAASSICPMRSRRTLAFVTSTPQRSQTTPLYLIFLYLPQ